ncbi:MAG TPA: AAA family ATPase [Candidatus Saccharimonadales bacterium]|nr:AAA family ATPase [Candidatus Saccharimonadales bacterium]
MAKLIILRGPSGAGKSTVAKALHTESKRKMALIEQDYYKEVMFNDKKSSVAVRHEMIINDVLLALRHGFDVILDGIFSLPSHQSTFDTLLAEHPTENYLFYFDISFEETVRRHQTRWQKDRFNEADMRQWYRLGEATGHPAEHIIRESSTLDETVAFIRKSTGL